MKRYFIWLQLALWMVVGSAWWWVDTRAIKRFVPALPAAQLRIRIAQPLLPPAIPPVQRVVMVIVSGVGASKLNDPANPFAFRTLRRLAAEGAWGISDTVVPSGDRPTWTALLTGAPPRISGVVSEQGGFTLDSLPGTAHGRIIIGSQRALLSRGVVAGSVQVQPIASSDRVAEEASVTLRSNHRAFVIVVLDVARREQYTGSQLWERVDTQLSEITQTLDPQRDSLLVTADHGLLPDGSFGGEEPAVTQTPVVLWGAGVSPGPVGTVQQVDLAPTIALLLGEGLPVLSVGRPIFEALRLTPEEQARVHLDWLDQQLALATQLGMSMRSPEVALAHRAFAQANWAATVVAAEVAVPQLTGAPVSSNLAGSVYVWSIGLPLLLLLGARMLARWGRRLAHWLALPVLGVELYVLTWSLIFFVLAGRTISLSALYSNIGGQLLSVGVWSVLALSVAVLPLTWAAVGHGPADALRQVGYLVGMLQLIGAVLAGTIWLAVKQPVAQTGAWTGLLLVLAQLAGIGLAAPAVGAFAAAVTDVFERGR